MKSSAQMAVILADLSRLGIVNSGKNVLNRMLLEKILGIIWMFMVGEMTDAELAIITIKLLFLLSLLIIIIIVNICIFTTLLFDD